MNRALAAPRTRPLLLVGGGGLAVALLSLGFAGALFDEARITGAVLPALLLYLTSHGFRLLRTLVVLGDSARAVRLVLLAHLASAPWGLLPLKVGEIARMLAIGEASEGPGHGLRVVWIERTFDAALLVLAAAAALALLPGSAPLVLPVLVLSATLLILTLLAVVALPENLATAKLWVMRRYTTDWSLTALRLLDDAGDAVRALRHLVAGRVATLAVLTLAIWSCEVLGLWLLVPRLTDLSEHVLVGMLAVLSDVLRLEGGLATSFGAATSTWRALVVLTLAGMAPAWLALHAWTRRHTWTPRA